jgi:hypothetical protein
VHMNLSFCIVRLRMFQLASQALAKAFPRNLERFEGVRPCGNSYSNSREGETLNGEVEGWAVNNIALGPATSPAVAHLLPPSKVYCYLSVLSGPHSIDLKKKSLGLKHYYRPRC